MVAIVADLIAYYFFKDARYISAVSIIVLILWYLLVELTFVSKYHTRWAKNFIYIVLMISAFYSTYFIPNLIVGGLIYLTAYILITLTLYFKELKNIFARKKTLKTT